MRSTDETHNETQLPHDSESDTATNSSDEFDRDHEDEDGIEDEKNLKAKRGRRLWLTFLKLARPIRVLLVGMLGVAILIIPLLVVNLRFRESRVKLQIYVWSLWLAVIWAASCGTYLVVDAIPLIARAAANLVGGQAERLKSQLELTMAVSGWLKLVLDVSWAWIALSIITVAYQPSGYYWVIINRVMQALFSASVLLLVEKFFLHFVAINFHRRASAERIIENKLALKVLHQLSNAPALNATFYGRKGHKTHESAGGMVDADNDQIYNRGTIDSALLNEKEESEVSNHRSKIPRRSRTIASVIVDQVGGAIGQVALKNSKFYRSGGLYSARKLARKLFSDLNPSRSCLNVGDFYPYFRTTAEAHRAFALFDKDDNGDISKVEMREAVQRIYRERKALTAGLKDVGSIVAKLDAVLLSVVLAAVIFICLLIFNRSDSLASLVPLATVILGFSFIFGNSAAALFGSLIFIFSTHVFDVGDLVMIDDQPLFVREFGLFSTTFRRVDGVEIVAPNSLLASQKLVHNLRRSKSMWESTTVTVSYDTPMDVIEAIKARVNSYIAANSREWSGCSVNIDKMEYQNAIHLIVAVEHRPNWQDWGGRWERRTAFMRSLKMILEDLGVHYTMPIQPVLLPRSAVTSTNMLEGRDNQGAGYFNRSPSSSQLHVPSLHL
ncbi:Mechanosensitive ion channel-domain-containing protein [Amanita rubescens]|nr:Mechanosensitive ion channel-domain-containing protein [Amanita rubescens]